MKVDEFLQKFDVRSLKSESQRRGNQKISGRVFDDMTLSTLSKLHQKNAFDTIESIVSQGKEANLFYGLRGDVEVAVKIYCFETSDFKNMGRYLRGDPRFGDWKNKRQLISFWAQKEFKNLKRVCEKISCPEPVSYLGNVVVMSFVGNEGYPAPKLREVGDFDDVDGVFSKVVGYVKSMYDLRLVHGDLSEYNILYLDGPVFIDMGQSVLLDHPEADSFLRRDILNVCKFFRKWGVAADVEDVYGEVTGK